MPENTDKTCIIILDAEGVTISSGAFQSISTISADNLRKIMARACNVWPSAPVEVKELHDMIVHGKILQDYRSLPVFTRREDMPVADNLTLDNWASENSEAGG